ncbi:hypothetical protein A0J61_11307, partial [Choanephora cucurbitarum]
MTQTTLKSTLLNGGIGGYEASEAGNLRHNYELAEMVYEGTLGLFYQTGDPAIILKQRVIATYTALQEAHLFLARYQLQKLVYSLVNYHIKENAKYIGTRRRNEWPNNYYLPEDIVHLQVSELNFEDLYIGQDSTGANIRMLRPSLIALLFPYLYPECKGHYSIATPTEEHRTLAEDYGEIAKFTLAGEILKGYTRLRMMMKDRRVAKNQSFLSFMLDAIENNNIAAANRLVISTKGRSNIRQRDVIDATTKTYNKNIVSTVPYVVRSSYAYKRRNFLNLQTVFNNLGAPQLFLTFSCNDHSPDFAAATDTRYPWEDPVLFINHFRRKWNYFFNIYALSHFAIQDRGSPHIHCVLWTEKSLQELIRLNVTTCNESLVPLVEADTILARYCKRGRNITCRFAYPKQPARRTEFVVVWRADMNIQYNC